MPNTSSNGPFACNRPSRHEGALLQTSEVALDCLFSSGLVSPGPPQSDAQLQLGIVAMIGVHGDLRGAAARCA